MANINRSELSSIFTEYICVDLYTGTQDIIFENLAAKIADEYASMMLNDAEKIVSYFTHFGPDIIVDSKQKAQFESHMSDITGIVRCRMMKDDSISAFKDCMWDYVNQKLTIVLAHVLANNMFHKSESKEVKDKDEVELPTSRSRKHQIKELVMKHAGYWVDALDRYTEVTGNRVTVSGKNYELFMHSVADIKTAVRTTLDITAAEEDLLHEVVMDAISIVAEHFITL